MRQPKSPRIVHPQKRGFLAAYRNSGNIRASCEAVGVSRPLYYWWTEHDNTFALAAQVAKEEYGDMLEATLTQMAVKERNVQALITALKMAGRFVERTRNEVSGPNGQPIQFDSGADIDSAIERRLAALAAPGQSPLPVAALGTPEPANA